MKIWMIFVPSVTFQETRTQNASMLMWYEWIHHVISHSTQ